MPSERLPPSRSLKSSLKPIRQRVWTAGRIVVLLGLLAVTYGAFFLTAVRVTTRARQVRVPDLQGKSVTAATATLANAGLTLKIELRRADAQVPADHVLSQDPAAGSVIREDRSIRVRVSDGQREPIVPPLIGELAPSAELALADEKITVAEADIHTADYPANTIVGQNPPPKARAATVALLVNRGDTNATYVMPDVIGTLAVRVVDILRRHGFRATVTADVPYPGLPPGVIVKQTPQAGFEIGAGDPVELEVSQ